LKHALFHTPANLTAAHRGISPLNREIYAATLHSNITTDVKKKKREGVNLSR
jgi:hypothetical protein